MDNKKLLTVGVVGVAAYMFLNKSGTPGAGGNPLTAFTNALIPGAAAANNTATALYGVNPGLAANGTISPATNYAQLAQADPNLLNPRYIMTPAENAQYLANYLDLRQGLPGWVGHKDAWGTPANLSDAAQAHWFLYGCGEKRIFFPFVPASGAPYVPPPPNPKSSGGGFFSFALKAVTVIGGAAITVATGGAAAPLVAAGESVALAAENKISGTDLLTDKDVEIIFTGAAILNDILPLYLSADYQRVTAIQNKLDDLLKFYS